MIEVFFDGKCGLCSKEIAYYQRITPPGIFVWLDIATDESPLAAHQISQADALRYLHVRDAAGNWHIGAAAFLVIWQQLRYWRFLAVLIGLPIIRQIAAMVYNRFADYRFAKLAHCQIAQKNLAEATTRLSDHEKKGQPLLRQLTLIGSKGCDPSHNSSGLSLGQ